MSRLLPDHKIVESADGYVLFVTGVHQEATEEDILDFFSDFAPAKSVTINLDRQTGFVKGHAIVNFSSKSDAQDAARGANGKELLGQTVHIDFCFQK